MVRLHPRLEYNRNATQEKEKKEIVIQYVRCSTFLKLSEQCKLI